MSEKLVESFTKLLLENSDMYDEDVILKDNHIMVQKYEDCLLDIKSKLSEFKFEDIDNFLNKYDKYCAGTSDIINNSKIETVLSLASNNIYAIQFIAYLFKDINSDEKELIGSSFIIMKDNSSQMQYSEYKIEDVITDIKDKLVELQGGI